MNFKSTSAKDDLQSAFYLLLSMLNGGLLPFTLREEAFKGKKSKDDGMRDKFIHLLEFKTNHS